jgi:hypothetical protein
MATTPLEPTQSANGSAKGAGKASGNDQPTATLTVRDRLFTLATRFQRVDLTVEVYLNDPAIGDGAELSIRNRIASLLDGLRREAGISGFTDVSFDSTVETAIEISVGIFPTTLVDGAWADYDRSASAFVYDLVPGKGAVGGQGIPAVPGDELFVQIREFVGGVLLDRELVLDVAFPSDSGETPSAVVVASTPDGDRTFDYDLRRQIGAYQSRSDTTVRPSLALWVTLPSVYGVSDVGQRRIDERVGQAVGAIARIAGLPEADVQVSFAPATDSVHQAYGISATFSERTGPGGPGLPVPGQACDTPVFGIEIFGTDTYGNAPAAGRHEDPLLVDIRDLLRAVHERAITRQDKPSRSERQLASRGWQGAGWQGLGEGAVIGHSDDLQLVIEINPGGRKACTRVYKAVQAGIRGWALATLGISDLPILVISADPLGAAPRNGFVTKWSVGGTDADPTGLRPVADRIPVTPPEGSTLVVVNAILDAFLAVTADYAGPSSRHIREDAEARLHKAFAEWQSANESYRLALRDVETDCTSEAQQSRQTALLACIDREARVTATIEVFRDYAPVRCGDLHQWVDGILRELEAASYVH